MLAKSLKEFLDQRNIKYVTVRHSPAYTASEIAQSVHIPGSMMAKTVMILIDGALAMAVVPANRRVRLGDLRDLTGTEDLRLAHENDFRARFPDCDPGAMPPFGNLYQMPVYVSPELAQGGEIAFNAGSHTEIIRMAWGDFESLVKPRVASFTA